MLRAVLAQFAITLPLCACTEPELVAAPSELDPVGQSMLSSVRNEALAVPALIERLALPSRATVADLGAGPGFLTLPLARAVHDGRVIATDIRREYLEVLAERAAAAGVRNISTRVVAADDPGLEAASVDLALLCQLDQLLADRTAYLRALIPALRPGGRIALVNSVRFREADRAAAERASLSVIDEWQPSVPFFLMVLQPRTLEPKAERGS